MPKVYNVDDVINASHASVSGMKRNNQLLNRFLDKWYELYPKEYDKFYNRHKGNQHQMIINFTKMRHYPRTRRVSTKVTDIMMELNATARS